MICALKKYFVLLYILYFLIALPLYGNKIVIENFNEKYGWSKNIVNCMYMFQDSRGFLWFGMANGLYKFDLNSFTHYSLRKNEINGFPESDIRAINEYAPGLLLIGTYNKGLMVYNTVIEKYDLIKCNSPIDFSKLYVHCIHVDNSGMIWIGTFDGLIILKYSGKENNEFEFITKIDVRNTALVSNEVVGITESKGEVWFLTMSDIGSYDPLTKKIKTYPTYGANSAFTFLNDNNILIGCFDAGLKIFNTENFKLENFKIEGINEASQIRYVYKDKQSNIWLSISNEGLVLLEPGIQKPFITHISNKKSEFADLSSNVIYNINESKDGALWICGEAGVNMIYLKKNYFSSYSTQLPERNSEFEVGIRAMLNSENGFIWTGTIGDGLKKFDITTKKFDNVPLINNGRTIGKNIQAIIRDHKNNIWIGTEGEGVIKYIPDKQSGFTKGSIINYRIYPQSFPAKSLLNDYIMCLLEDRDKNIWIGTWYGLSLIEKSELEKPDQSEIVIKNFLNDPSDKFSISNNIIMSLWEDTSGNILVGTQEGINRVIKNNNTYKFDHKYKNKEGILLSEKKILIIFQSKKGTLWFSTQDGGICTLDRNTGTFMEYNSENGFNDNIINSISEDSIGILWFGTNNGLCRFDPETFSFNTFTKQDGLLYENFFFKSNCNDKDYLYFGGSKGITAFNPNDIVPLNFKPNLVFTDLKLFNKPIIVNFGESPLKQHISNIKSLTLKHNQNFITISFAALNYKQYQDVQYSCILEGLEPSWNNLGKENKITYNNLIPGRYLLRVKALGSNDLKNFSEISLKIIVTPPYWKTTLAYAFYALLILFTLFQIYRFLVNKEKQKNAFALERMNAKRIHELDLMKLHFFTNISHEFRTPLTLLSAPLETLIKENTESAKSQTYYQLMLKNVQRLKRLIDQLLDLRKVEEGYLKMEWNRGDIIEFIEKTFNSFQNYAEKRNIYFTFHSDISQLFTFFDADKLDKVLFNLLSNAFKYTPDYGSISLKLDEKEPKDIPFNGLTGKYIEIKISDSGFGIPKESLDKLFHPFQQVNTNKPIGSAATGIGLSLTKELVDLHHGFISVNSEVNKGSTFTVFLPIKNNLEVNMQNPEMETSEESVNLDLPGDISPEQVNVSEKGLSGSKPLILIVEDNSDLRAFLRNELKNDFRTIESANGKDGFEQAIDKVPDMVISDIMMEKMDGVELCKKIKIDERTSHIPVILLTARHSEEVKLNGYETGADDYITKPFNMVLLTTRINNLIVQRRKLRKLFSKENNFDFSSVANKTDSRFLEKLNLVIEKNLSDPDFDPSKLASDMAMSRMQLYRKVTALTNQTVYNYIRTIRLNKAAELLVTTDMQIAEIAFSVGYTEPSNFTKCFTRQFNQTPSQFTRSKRK